MCREDKYQAGQPLLGRHQETLGATAVATNLVRTPPRRELRVVVVSSRQNVRIDGLELMTR